MTAGLTSAPMREADSPDDGASPDQGETSEEVFLQLVDDVRTRAAELSLSPLAGAILAALHLEICRDSRTFARLFGIPHALVLREITDLSGDAALVAILDRNPRTQRTELSLTAAGRSLFD